MMTILDAALTPLEFLHIGIGRNLGNGFVGLTERAQGLGENVLGPTDHIVSPIEQPPSTCFGRDLWSNPRPDLVVHGCDSSHRSEKKEML
jgi:hypothetical protein